MHFFNSPVLLTLSPFDEEAFFSFFFFCSCFIMRSKLSVLGMGRGHALGARSRARDGDLAGEERIESRLLGESLILSASPQRLDPLSRYPSGLNERCRVADDDDEDCDQSCLREGENEDVCTADILNLRRAFNPDDL